MNRPKKKADLTTCALMDFDSGYYKTLPMYVSR
jgi:hypothetical protein